MTWGQIAMASYVGGLALWFFVVIRRTHRHEREYLAGRRCGRAMAAALQSIKEFWEPQLAVECRAAIFFSLAPIDGPESYAAQLHDPDVREAVRRFIERRHVRMIGIDPVPAVDGMRLKVSFEWYRTRRPPPVDIVAIVDEVFALASMLEERFGADAS